MVSVGVSEKVSEKVSEVSEVSLEQILLFFICQASPLYKVRTLSTAELRPYHGEEVSGCVCEAAHGTLVSGGLYGIYGRVCRTGREFADAHHRSAWDKHRSLCASLDTRFVPQPPS
jgi:hypothetical protein